MNNEANTIAQKNNELTCLDKCVCNAALNTAEGRMYMRRLTVRVLCEMRLEETIREEVNTL